MMSSIASSHGGGFSQQQQQQSPPPPPPPTSFYKREPPSSDRYQSDQVPLRTRHPSDYPNWSPLPQMSSPQWMGEVACDTTTPHIGGGLPAAHNLLNFSKTPTSVLADQNGKGFSSTNPAYSASRFGAANNSNNFASSANSQVYEQPSPVSSRVMDFAYTSRDNGYAPGGTLSAPSCGNRWEKDTNDLRTASFSNTGGITGMDYIDGRCPLTPGSCDAPAYTTMPPKAFHGESNPQQYPPVSNFRSQPPSSGMAGIMTDLSDSMKPTANGFGANGVPSRGASVGKVATSCSRYAVAPDSTAGSATGSIASSDGETTTSSSATRGNKRTRKPAPTLATGRRNLKCEPVDADEADRRLKRRERNRKSAQKCRERKLHRTQELQAQVEGLNMEANRLLREVESWRDQARRCVQLLQQHCPGVAIPYLSCLVEPNPSSNETTFLSATMGNGGSSGGGGTTPDLNTFCDEGVGFYKSSGWRNGTTFTQEPTRRDSVTAASGHSQLPPMSHLVAGVPLRRQSSPSSGSRLQFDAYGGTAAPPANGQSTDHRPCSLSAPSSYWASPPTGAIVGKTGNAGSGSVGVIDDESGVGKQTLSSSI